MTELGGITLYEFPRTRSARCRWTLQELGVSFTSVKVDLPRGEHRSPEFLAINPNGKVPVLVDVDHNLTLFESVAICVHLGDRFAQSGLMPEPGSRERALHEQWLLFCATELEQPLWRMRRHTVLYPEARRLPGEVELAREDFAAAAEVLEKTLAGRRFLVGDRFSVADVVCAYTLRWASWGDLLGPWPGLHAYLEDHCSRSACPAELES